MDGQMMIADVQAVRAENIVYGGFWRRAVALILDILILLVANNIIALIIGVVHGVLLVFSHHTLDKAAFQRASIPWLLLILTVNSWLYFTSASITIYGATLGKAAMGLRVVDENMQRISFAKSNVRYWSSIISVLLAGFGFWMVAWTKKKQGLHDIFAKTIVIRRRKTEH